MKASGICSEEPLQASRGRGVLLSRTGEERRSVLSEAAKRAAWVEQLKAMPDIRPEALQEVETNLNAHTLPTVLHRLLCDPV